MSQLKEYQLVQLYLWSMINPRGVYTIIKRPSKGDGSLVGSFYRHKRSLP